MDTRYRGNRRRNQKVHPRRLQPSMPSKRKNILQKTSIEAEVIRISSLLIWAFARAVIKTNNFSNIHSVAKILPHFAARVKNRTRKNLKREINEYQIEIYAMKRNMAYNLLKRKSCHEPKC
jgi:hypothetical protein